MLYIYGISPAGASAPDMQGIRGAPVRVIEHEGLAALVSDVDEPTELDAADAERHLDVLVAALREGPVLPIRLGTFAPDDDGVRREALTADAGELRDRLDALADVVELHVDAEDEERASLASLLSGSPVDVRAQSFEERVEMGQRLAYELVEYRRQIGDAAVSKLRPHAIDDAARSELAGPEDPVLRWAFLVNRDELGDFDEAVARLRGDMPELQFTYVGPLPVTHFDPRPATGPGAPADSFGGSGAWGW